MRIEIKSPFGALIVGALLLIAGCGQKGPLRQPDPPSASADAASVPAGDPTSLAARRSNPHE